MAGYCPPSPPFRCMDSKTQPARTHAIKTNVILITCYLLRKIEYDAVSSAV